MRWAKFFIKITIAVGIIFMIWSNFNFFQIKFVLTNTFLLVIIPICWILNLFLTTLRLHTILCSLGHTTKLIDIFAANMSSLFIGNLMPGLIGIDVVKFFYIKKNNSAITTTQLTLILAIDRILGLVAIIFWCTIFSFFMYQNVGGENSIARKILTYLPMFILFLIIFSLYLFNYFVVFISRLKIYNAFRQFVDVYQHLMSVLNKKTLTAIIIYNLTAVFILLAGLVLVGSQLHIQQTGEAKAIQQFFLIPLSLITSMLPITPMGIGISQITMSVAYKMFGLDSSVGVNLSTLSQMGLLIVSLVIGGAFFIVGKRKSK